MYTFSTSTQFKINPLNTQLILCWDGALSEALNEPEINALFPHFFPLAGFMDTMSNVLDLSTLLICLCTIISPGFQLNRPLTSIQKNKINTSVSLYDFFYHMYTRKYNHCLTFVKTSQKENAFECTKHKKYVHVCEPNVDQTYIKQYQIKMQPNLSEHIIFLHVQLQSQSHYKGMSFTIVLLRQHN